MLSDTIVEDLQALEASLDLQALEASLRYAGYTIQSNASLMNAIRTLLSQRDGDSDDNDDEDDDNDE
jgi:hypothetical protein